MLNEFRRSQASAHFERGRQFERSGRLEEAMAEFKNAVEADPSYAAAHNALGHHYRRKGLLTKATEEFRMAVKLAQDYESYFNLGRVLFDLDRHSEAREAFQRCLALSPGDPSARYELACANYGLGDYHAAVQEMDDLVTLFPEDWEFPYVLGSCYLRLGQYGQAERQLRRALALAQTEEDSWPIGDALSVAQRAQEFAPEQTLGVKDRFYQDHGVVCLGTGHDDGLQIPEYFLYNFAYQDVAITLRRFQNLADAFGWGFDAIVSLDAESAPLALALSEMLSTPTREIDELHDDQFVLLIFGIGRAPELLQVAMERLPDMTISFGLSVSWLSQSDILPDVIGVATQEESSLPWRRVTPLSRQHVPDEEQGRRAIVLKPPYEDTRAPDKIAADILRAVNSLPWERNWREQVDYYNKVHTRLRFFEG